ncbi:hypothetical protein ACP3VQ_13655 [Metapseudomonas otitidis]|uniref:hypothetical protein n=1 Tax=Metapseudomonas otitidis TaxID=319939 RepID=UPI003CE82DF9
MASTIGKSIEFLQDHATAALKTATGLANRMSSFTPAQGGINFNYSPNKPNLQPPPSFGDLLPGDTSPATIRFLDAEVDKWLEKFFPELSGALKYAPEEWLVGIITGQSPLGLSKEHFDTVWHEGRDRAYRAAASEQAALRANFSERGFSIPPGALIGAINSSEIRAGEAIADVNRQQNIRNAEIKLDLLKFAEEQAIRLKLGIMGEVATFYGRWIELMNKDVDVARSKAQAYAALSSALSSFYNVELGFEELRLRAAQGRFEADVQRNRAGMVEGEVRAAQNSALAQAARAIGDISGAAASAQSSLQADIFSGSV